MNSTRNDSNNNNHHHPTLSSGSSKKAKKKDEEKGEREGEGDKLTVLSSSSSSAGRAGRTTSSHIRRSTNSSKESQQPPPPLNTNDFKNHQYTTTMKNQNQIQNEKKIMKWVTQALKQVTKQHDPKKLQQLQKEMIQRAATAATTTATTIPKQMNNVLPPSPPPLALNDNDIHWVEGGGIILGQGGFCTVSLVQSHKLDLHLSQQKQQQQQKQYYAVKQLSLYYNNNNNNVVDYHDSNNNDKKKINTKNIDKKHFLRGLQDLLWEVTLLSKLLPQHENIIPILGITAGNLFDPSTYSINTIPITTGTGTGTTSGERRRGNHNNGLFLVLPLMTYTLKDLLHHWSSSSSSSSSSSTTTSSSSQEYIRSLLHPLPPNAETLSHRLKTYALQIAQGMEFLHSHGILYRDLKPTNIGIQLVVREESQQQQQQHQHQKQKGNMDDSPIAATTADDEGSPTTTTSTTTTTTTTAVKVVLMDFGIARPLVSLTSRRERLWRWLGGGDTMSSILSHGNNIDCWGSIRYMAPEILARQQQQHQNDRIGLPSDVYSFAIVLWQLATLDAQPYGSPTVTTTTTSTSTGYNHFLRTRETFQQAICGDSYDYPIPIRPSSAIWLKQQELDINKKKYPCLRPNRTTIKMALSQKYNNPLSTSSSTSSSSSSSHSTTTTATTRSRTSQLIADCWTSQPSKRPTFHQIISRLQESL